MFFRKSLLTIFIISTYLKVNSAVLLGADPNDGRLIITITDAISFTIDQATEDTQFLGFVVAQSFTQNNATNGF